MLIELIKNQILVIIGNNGWMDNTYIDHYNALWSINRRLITNWIRLLMDNNNMNIIKHLKDNKIELNGVVYKPYKICELPPSFGVDILKWVNYRGYTYIIEWN